MPVPRDPARAAQQANQDVARRHAAGARARLPPPAPTRNLACRDPAQPDPLPLRALDRPVAIPHADWMAREGRGSEKRRNDQFKPKSWI